MEKNPIGARLYQEVNGSGVPIIFIGEHRIHGFTAGRVTKVMQNTGLL
jgi:hypothetical protein